MRPLTTQTHQSQTRSTRITIRTALKLLAICLIVAAVPLALYVRVKSEDSARWFSKAEDPVARTKRPKEHVTVQAAGRSESTRLNSSHLVISYAVLCLKKKKS